MSLSLADIGCIAIAEQLLTLDAGGAVNSNSRLAEYISSCSAFIFLMQCACGDNPDAHLVQRILGKWLLVPVL